MNQTEKVGFTQAFKDFWKGYVKFNGRTTRAGFWWAMLSLVLLWLIPVAIGFINPILALILIGILSLALFLPCLSIQCRRLEDLGLSFGVSLTLVIISIVLPSIVANFQALSFIVLAFEIVLLVLYCLPTDQFKK